MVISDCEGIASYNRPQLIEIWPHAQRFPLTRVAKVDKLALQGFAEPLVEGRRVESG